MCKAYLNRGEDRMKNLNWIYLGRHWFIKPYRFQVYDSINYYLHMAFCFHCPKLRLWSFIGSSSSSCHPCFLLLPQSYQRFHLGLVSPTGILPGYAAPCLFLSKPRMEVRYRCWEVASLFWKKIVALISKDLLHLLICNRYGKHAWLDFSED